MRSLVRCLRAKSEDEFSEGFKVIDKFLSIIGYGAITVFVLYLGVHGVFYLLK